MKNCNGVNTFFDWACQAGQNGIVGVLMTIFNWASTGVLIVVVAGIIIGAITYITAHGSQEQAKQGIERVRNAALALALYFAMWALLNFLVPGGVFNAQGEPNISQSEGVWAITASTRMTTANNMAVAEGIGDVQGVKNRIMLWVVVGLMTVVNLTTVLTPQPVSALACDGGRATDDMLGFPAWYNGLPCRGNSLNLQGANIGNDVVWPVVLNVVEILLRVAGVLAALFIIISGIQHMIARGEVEKQVSARRGIMQASIGLGVAASAAGAVGFISKRIGTSTPISPSSLGAAVTNTITLLYWLVGAVCVTMILYSAYQLLTSKGFPDKALTARRTLVGAIIGLVFCLVAAIIVGVVVGV